MSPSDGNHMASCGRPRPIAPVRWVTVMARIVLVIWAGTVASADEQPVRMSTPPSMIGKLVTDREGNVLGRIRDVVFHWRSDGYAEYAVLSMGGFWDVGEAHVAVPSRALSPNTRKDHFALNMNKVQLNEDPELVVYRLYDRSVAAVLGAGRSPAAPSADAMGDNIVSTENVSETTSFGIRHVMKPEFTRERS
ncbi:MAG: PRC-barrel domain-containing protein [Nitrospira sp.]